MKAIGLIRVSTLVQDLQQQADAVKAEMLKDGYTEDNIKLIQNKESATKLSEEERQGLVEMKDYINNNPDVNCVYVFELSRLSRRPEILYSIRDFLLSRSINLIVLKPYMRLLEDGKLSPSGSIMFGIFGAMSEQEGYIRKERFKRGKMKAQLEGKSLGNWLPLGYTTDSERHIIIDEEKVALVRKIFYMCLVEDKSTTAIARELSETGEWPTPNTIKTHASSIRNILHDSAYIGKGRYNKKRQKENYNQYPLIIDEDTFNKVQTLLIERQKKPKTEHKNIYYCKGILRDKNSNMLLLATPCVASYCYCCDRADPIKHKSVTVPINLFDCFAWHLTKQYIINTGSSKSKEVKKNIEKNQVELKKKIDNLNNKIDELYQKIEKIQRRIIDGKVSETLGDKMIEDIVNDREDLKVRMNDYSREYHLNTYRLHKYESGEITNDILSVDSDEEKSKLVHEVIKLIQVEKNAAPLSYGTKRNGLGVKYGIMYIHYENDTVEQYKFNSYTKKVFTMDDKEIEYGYYLRIAGQQHTEDYWKKQQKWREEWKAKKKVGN